MNYFFTIDQLPFDTVEIEMNGNTFYYSKNRDECYKKTFVTPAYGSSIHKRIFKHEAYRAFLSDFRINTIPQVEENRKNFVQEEKARNNDWRDKYNVLWDKYIALRDECRALKEQDLQKENEPNSK